MMVKEMGILREALDRHGIEWEDVSNSYITRTHFEVDGVKRSVIHGMGTYGGQAGLLEIMPPLNYGSDDVSTAEDVQGWCSAADITAALNLE